MSVLLLYAKRIFQSTLPVRGATADALNWAKISEISIHAPREGSDSPALPSGPEFGEFQSTLPVRGATCSMSQV